MSAIKPSVSVVKMSSVDLGVIHTSVRLGCGGPFIGI